MLPAPVLRAGLLVALTVLPRPAGLAAADAVLSRPGRCTVLSLAGEATLTENGRTRPLQTGERVPADATVRTGRRSLLTLALSNGSRLDLGPEAELALEELVQGPFAVGLQPETLPQEPSVSQTRLRLAGGDLRLAVRPLRVAQGSVLAVVTPAGALRIAGGSARAQVRMTAGGLGWCGFELLEGTAEFERAGGPAAALAPGRRLDLAVEPDPSVPAGVRVSEAPSPR